MIVLPDILRKDLESNTFNVYPIISIDDEIFISQFRESFDGEIYEDHNLQISSIKQSIDFESRNFKIGNISIKMSNYDNLSDKLSSIDIMNKIVHVYWKSSSCKTIADCLHVYQANIRRYDHSEKTITLKLEDKTQEKISKDVPIANLGNSAHVYSDKYINKYIPITYGWHEYAPAVIWKDSSSENPTLDFKVICDDVFDITKAPHRSFGDGSSRIYTKTFHVGSPYSGSPDYFDGRPTSLRAFKGEYVHIYAWDLWKMNQNPSGLTDTHDGADINYQCYNKYIKCYLKFNGNKPNNMFAANEFQGHVWRIPTSVEVVEGDGYNVIGQPSNVFNWYDYNATDDTNISGGLTFARPHESFGNKIYNVENEFDLLPNDSYAVIPDIDGGTFLDYIVPEGTQAEFDDYIEDSFSDFLDYHYLHKNTINRETVDDNSITVGGNILDFAPIQVFGCTFRACDNNFENGTPHIWFNTSVEKNQIDYLQYPPRTADETVNDMHQGIVPEYPESIYYPSHGNHQSVRPIDWFGKERGNQNGGGKSIVYSNIAFEDYSFEHPEDDGWYTDYSRKKIGHVIKRDLNSPTGVVNWEEQSRIARYKYACMKDTFAMIQLPDAKKIMERLVYLGIVPSMNYFTGCNDLNWYGNYINYTDPYMGRAVDSGGTDGNGDPITFRGYFADNYFQWGSPASGHGSGYVQNEWDEDIYRTWDTRNGRWQADGTVPWVYNNANDNQGNHYYESHANTQVTVQPHIYSIERHGNIIWLFGIKNFQSDHTPVFKEHEVSSVHAPAQTKFIAVTYNAYRNDNSTFRWHAGANEPDKSPAQVGGDNTSWQTFEEEYGFNIQPHHLTDKTGFDGSGEILLGQRYDKDGNLSSKRGDYSLCELFDMRTFPLYIPYNTVSLNARGQEYSETSSAVTIAPSYDCYWNGVSPDNEAVLGTGEGTPGFPNVSKFNNGGVKRWYALCLKTPPNGSNYTRHSFLQSCYGLSVPNVPLEYDGWMGSLDKQTGYIRFIPGSIQSDPVEGFLSVRSQNQSQVSGKRLSLKFMLPDLNLSDNIEDAHECRWYRKIKVEVPGISDLFTNDIYTKNFFEFYGSSVDVDVDDPNDYVATSTSLFKENFRFLIANSNPLGQNSFWFNNVDGSGSLANFREDSTQEPPSAAGSNLFASMFNSQAGMIQEGHIDNNFTSNNYITWNNANDFNSVTANFLASNDGSVAAVDFPFRVKIYNSYIRHVIDFDNFNTSDFYMATEGRGFFADAGGTWIRHENPSDVIKDLVKIELNLQDSEINYTEFMNAEASHGGWGLAFSVPDKINSKKLIQEICTNTKMFPRINSENKFGLIRIRDAYNSALFDKMIDSKDILSYSFSKSKIEEVKTKVMVKFNMDYARKELVRNTGWISCKDYLGDGDLGYFNQGVADAGHDGTGYRCSYYNLNPNEEESTLVFEAKYINKMNHAKMLQRFLAMWHCQQHLIISLDLSLKYMGLEVGDLIRIDKLIGGLKAYGEDYTEIQYRNSSRIYPLFLITDITKSPKKVSLKATQLHKLNQTIYNSFQKGDINRDGQVTEQDLSLLQDYIDNNASGFTDNQIKLMDMNSSGGVSTKDRDLLQEHLGIITDTLNKGTGIIIEDESETSTLGKQDTTQEEDESQDAF